VLGFQLVLLHFGLLGVWCGYRAYRVALRDYPPEASATAAAGGAAGGGSGAGGSSGGGSPRAGDASSNSGVLGTVAAWWSRLTGSGGSSGGGAGGGAGGGYGSAGSYNADLAGSPRAGSRDGAGSSASFELNSVGGSPSYVSFGDRKDGDMR